MYCAFVSALPAAVRVDQIVGQIFLEQRLVLLDGALPPARAGFFHAVFRPCRDDHGVAAITIITVSRRVAEALVSSIPSPSSYHKQFERDLSDSRRVGARIRPKFAELAVVIGALKFTWLNALNNSPRN